MIVSLYQTTRRRIPKDHNFDTIIRTPSIVQVMKSRRMRRAGQVVRVGYGSGVYRVLVGKPVGKGPLGRRRWEDNIKMDLQEMG